MQSFFLSKDYETVMKQNDLQDISVKISISSQASVYYISIEWIEGELQSASIQLLGMSFLFEACDHINQGVQKSHTQNKEFSDFTREISFIFKSLGYRVGYILLAIS